MLEIKNDDLSARISPMGAELQSLRTNHNGHELIWQRDPDIWAGSAPILFPVVGRLREGRYILDGKTYEMPIHGIVRRREWTVLEKGDSHVLLETTDDDETRQSYPYNWSLNVRFELTDLQLSVQYQVENRDSRTMFFSLGSHPAFNLDFGGSDRIADYFLSTDHSRSPWRRHKVSDGGLSTEQFDLPWQGGDLQLSDAIFDEDALIFVGVNCRQLSLAHVQDSRQIIFDTGGAPDLGIWAKPGAPYVCIEPWYGYDDPEDHDQQLESKPGILSLERQGTFQTTYSVGLNNAWLETR